MPRIRRTRGSPVQDREDVAFGPGSPSSITVSAAPLKRPRGRPRKEPLESENPRTALAHKVSDKANISTSKSITVTPSSSRLRALRSPAPTDRTATDSVIHELGKKRKRDSSRDVHRTCLETACGGCKRRSYPHGENWEQDIVTICHKCNKEWHAQCTTRKGIQRVGGVGQWECRDCSIKGKPQPLQPAHTDDTEAEVALDRQARDTSRETDLVMEELDMPCITDEYGDLVNYTNTAVIQAQKAYEEASVRLNNGIAELRTCEERYNKIKSKIERYGDRLEGYRKQFDSDSVRPGDGESEHSTTHRLALGICSDRDWVDKVSDKINLIRDERSCLIKCVKSLQDDVRGKTATLKRVEQQRSMFSTCLETSCREIEKLRSKVNMDFMEDSPNSDSFSDSTMEDSATEDISPNGIIRGIERLAEEASQQHMMEYSKSNDERGQRRALSQLSETVEDPEHLISVEEFEPPQPPSQSRIIILPYGPATEVARLLERLEKADEGEIRDLSKPLEMHRVHGQPNPFKTGEAIQVLQELPQTLEAVKAPKQSDNGTSLQEPPPNITIEISRRIQRPHPHTHTLVSIPAAFAPSSKNFDRSKSSEPSNISLVPEDTSIITGDRNSGEPHSHRSVDEIVLPAEDHDVRAGVMNQHPDHQSLIPAEADSAAIGSGYENVFRSEPLPPVLGPSCSQSPANVMHNYNVLPPITRFLPRHGAPLALLRAGTRNHSVTGPLWSPNNASEIPCDAIINKYLKCLTEYTNARRESDIPDSCTKIAMIGSMDPIQPGLLKTLAAFSAIYIPIKLNTHWILAVLYPGPFGEQGRSEVYDSHKHWTIKMMTTDNVFHFLKIRLGDEYNPGDWTASAKQCSQSQRSDADSGLYVLANAKSIALSLGMMDLSSYAQSLSLRWQFAKELLARSIVEAF
ncbi:hypothetical protein V498_02395 [Pseudogymnoascus sp. VKM F-4517 (FW-2822)]|nr:hypothetical protein V498_02395 [Pseudogymnoascus sp. VKM F-4517 (FW-2822)]